jgi:hypothetical protein
MQHQPHNVGFLNSEADPKGQPLRIEINFQPNYSISIMDIFGFFRLGLITYPNGY